MQIQILHYTLSFKSITDFYKIKFWLLMINGTVAEIAAGIRGGLQPMSDISSRLIILDIVDMFGWNTFCNADLRFDISNQISKKN